MPTKRMSETRFAETFPVGTVMVLDCKKNDPGLVYENYLVVRITRHVRFQKPGDEPGKGTGELAGLVEAKIVAEDPTAMSYGNGYYAPGRVSTCEQGSLLTLEEAREKWGDLPEFRLEELGAGEPSGQA
ncbi:hypothetical protein [Actinomadura atramentaria]|uniref:hypothetical protein n=1 Tax=Actinomadura atramentaria TaxID=1990 RepID=UPI00037FB710|nr:hypothetical protein [Actinomadura atramentaria]